MNNLDVAPNQEDQQQEKLAFQVQHLAVAVERILRQQPEGISELHLIKALQQPPWELIGPVNYAEPDKLYPVHFLIFHVLYRLRDQLAGSDEALTISPLLIRLCRQDVVGGTGSVDAPDPLRAFYLDLSRYRMPEDSILRMMDDFWSGRHGRRPAQGEALEAAGVFGFDTVPISFDEVKYRFRRAVMQAHPDRGGETEAIQTLNSAFSVLKAHFQD
ncbi:DNA-J related domain-containing protein [Marinobacter confluentis]|uniref:Molecular chaperone DnaJ n=1 Tax=Marinobacter confluentis TaxID=1697557 RepID=A0A4Z1BVH0_9GAMM|nr:DNA-J related domain-containing protein [Marinobacter confluentis]TGN41399.1 molecular chaperone DnaJ [Marinobacter confluentis]